MKHFANPLCLIATTLSLGACAQLGMGQPEDARTAGADGNRVLVQTEGAVTGSLGATPPPPQAARTQEALDTTTPQQRAAAAAPAATGVQPLGSTVVSLGSPTEPGFWLKTPLVQTQMQGRVTNKANGKSAAVTLIPIEGPPTGGSRMSLPAMRLIEASVTDLTEIEVTSGG
jgi:hypothetical protein